MVIQNGRRIHLRSSLSQCDDIDYENHYFHEPDDIKENKTLAREVKGCSSILFYSSIFICIDVSRQIAGYGMKYYNGDQFPVEPTEIVAFSEVLKVIVFLLRIVQEEGTCLFLNRLSWRYLIPALLYAVNSNIYFVAMHYTTPPFWNILLQQRVIFTALMYRVVFGKTIKPIQWLALLLLTSSIFISKFSSSHELVSAEAKSSHDNDLVIAVLLSILASIIASMGPLYTEYLFKNDKRSFTEMQLQLYMYGSICTWSLYLLEGYYSGNTHQHRFIGEFQHLAMVMMIVCVTFTALIGISTAYIMKRLDNMVKLYAESLSGMLMTLACALLFPKRFAVDAVFVLSLLLTFAAIFLYEKDTLSSVEGVAGGVVSFGVAVSPGTTVQLHHHHQHHRKNTPLLVAMVALCLSLSVCLLLVVANVLDVEAVASNLRSAASQNKHAPA